jgi:cobalt/nickel transport system permease protein
LKHSFLDKYSHLDSPIHVIEPRVKLIAVFTGIVIIVSEPPGEIFSFSLYGLLIALLVGLSNVPLAYILKRCLIVSPFIIVAAVFYPLSTPVASGSEAISLLSRYDMALTIVFKAFSSVILLILLTSTEKFHNLLLGLRKLKMPKLLGIISALMYRYVFILSDEALRTTRARESRTPGKLRINKFRVYGNQSAMIFLRSLERSQVIYNSMLSRGFTGEFPVMQKSELTIKDIMVSACFILIMLVIRVTDYAFFHSFFSN